MDRRQTPGCAAVVRVGCVLNRVVDRLLRLHVEAEKRCYFFERPRIAGRDMKFTGHALADRMG